MWRIWLVVYFDHYFTDNDTKWMDDISCRVRWKKTSNNWSLLHIAKLRLRHSKRMCVSTLRKFLTNNKLLLGNRR